jgi:peptide/nickel transport system permease protein
VARFLLRRALTAVLVLLGTTVVTFLLARVIPANPAVTYLGPKARPEDVERVTRELGLDQPLPVQYGRYLAALVRGDWGTSVGSKRPVLTEIGERLPATLELLVTAMTVAAVCGVVLGVVAARRQGRLADHMVRLLAIGGVSMPAFWLGLILQVVFFGRLGWLPPTGRLDSDLEFTAPLTSVTGFTVLDAALTGNGAALGSAAAHLVLPALTLAAYPAGVLARMTRATMVEALGQDSIRTARAYGIPERLVHWRIALRNALPPVVTVIGILFWFLLGGAVLVETIFAWGGLGQYAVESVINSDYAPVQAVVLVTAVFTTVVFLLVDIAYYLLDPRISD